MNNWRYIIATTAAVLLAGCGTTTTDNGGKAPFDLDAPDYPASQLSSDVRKSFNDWMNDNGFGNTNITSIVCEDIPVMEKGAIADCHLQTDAPAPNDELSVRVTLEDEYGHFRWETY